MERKQENDEDEKDILLLGYAPFYVLGRKKERKKEEGGRERERERERERDRETERQRDREKERKRERLRRQQSPVTTKPPRCK